MLSIDMYWLILRDLILLTDIFTFLTAFLIILRGFILLRPQMVIVSLIYYYYILHILSLLSVHIYCSASKCLHVMGLPAFSKHFNKWIELSAAVVVVEIVVVAVIVVKGGGVGLVATAVVEKKELERNITIVTAQL